MTKEVEEVRERRKGNGSEREEKRKERARKWKDRRGE